MFKFINLKTKPLIIPIFIPHIGCPNKCAFCNQKSVTGLEQFSYDKIENTVDEYLSWSKKRKKTEISFYGGSFTAIPETEMIKYIEICLKYIKNGTVNALRCSTRPDAVNEKIITILKNNYFETVEIGVQTMSDVLLNKMNRGHTRDDVFKSVEILKKSGIKTGIQLMTGFPGETEKDVEITKLSLNKIKPDFLRIYPFVPLQNTLVYSRIEKGLDSLIDADIIVERTVTLFIEAMKNSIPVIRIGLPVSDKIMDIYPHNLFQVVVQRAIERIAVLTGEVDFILPDEWKTSFNMAKKNCPQIFSNFI